ncbi:MAG TPA: AAA-like domain-containing protein [Gemmataceae bacterium]
MSTHSSIPFQTGAALPPDSPVYIERACDREVVGKLEGMYYLTIIEPRQQGKTSFVYRLMQRNDFWFLYADLTTLNLDSEAGWRASLCQRLGLQHIRTRAEHTLFPPVGETWYDFLESLARHVEGERRRLVIVLDEIGASPSLAEPFFRALRAIYNERSIKPVFKRLTFILAGAYDPRDFIANSNFSPFNVAERLYLKDFMIDEVVRLVCKLDVPVDQRLPLAERIHFWTDGHPYLSQALCRYLAELSPSLAEQSRSLVPDDVDKGVKSLIQKDRNNLAHIGKELERDTTLREPFRRLLRGDQGIFFNPDGVPWHGRLELLGILKVDASGYCKVRNRIYQEAFASLPLVNSSQCLTGPQCEQLVKAILDGFDQPALQELLLFNWNEQLTNIAGNVPFRQVALEVVQWAANEGLIPELLNALAKARPMNAAVQKTVSDLRVV